MKALFLLFAIALSSSSYAQWMHDNYFTYSKSTDDGHIRILSSSKLSPGVKWVRVYVVGNGKTDDNIYPTNGEDYFDKVISLRHGPGQYKFQIMTSQNDEKWGMFQVEQQATVTNNYSEDLDTIDPTCDIQSDNEEIIELARSITQGLQSELEKAHAIHDWVASNIAYDTESYFAGTYQNKEWDAVTVLHNRLGICQGYSNLTAALNRAAGLHSVVVTGEADVFKTGWSGHAWNKVQVDGRWITEDTTWDAGAVNYQGKFHFDLKQKYFDPKPEVFALDHREKE
jgi:transglutaminase-like putative cysteine protease